MMIGYSVASRPASSCLNSVVSSIVTAASENSQQGVIISNALLLESDFHNQFTQPRPESRSWTILAYPTDSSPLGRSHFAARLPKTIRSGIKQVQTFGPFGRTGDSHGLEVDESNVSSFSCRYQSTEPRKIMQFAWDQSTLAPLVPNRRVQREGSLGRRSELICLLCTVRGLPPHPWERRPAAAVAVKWANPTAQRGFQYIIGPLSQRKSQ